MSQRALKAVAWADLAAELMPSSKWFPVKQSRSTLAVKDRSPLVGLTVAATGPALQLAVEERPTSDLMASR